MQRWAGKHRFAESIGFFGRQTVETVDQPWWKLTNILKTVWRLFLDLMDNSTSWAEEYRGEAADVFEQKIEVLIKYQVLNQLEETMLRDIVESMRSMTTPTKASNIGVVDDGDSLCCWERLYSAILPFKTIEEHWILDDWDLIDPTISRCLPHECHRFNIDPDCNVYKMYHDYQMQNDQIRPTLNRPWGSEGVVKREDGKWIDREWSRLFHSNEYTGLGMAGMVGRGFSRLPNWTEGCSYADIEKAVCERWADVDAKKRAAHGL
jgi:hypothetical protein